MRALSQKEYEYLKFYDAAPKEEPFGNTEAVTRSLTARGCLEVRVVEEERDGRRIGVQEIRRTPRAFLAVACFEISRRLIC